VAVLGWLGEAGTIWDNWNQGRPPAAAMPLSSCMLCTWLKQVRCAVSAVVPCKAGDHQDVDHQDVVDKTTDSTITQTAPRTPEIAPHCDRLGAKQGRRATAFQVSSARACGSKAALCNEKQSCGRLLEACTVAPETCMSLPYVDRLQWLN
jgi:hypothetical protein